MLTIHTLAVGEIQANCHLVADAQGQTLVIDPGAEPDAILALVARQRLTVAAYLLTHGHLDHVSGLADLHRHQPAPIGLAAADARWAFSAANRMLPFYKPVRPEGDLLDVGGMETWTAGGPACRILHTPGHTPGCVCYWFEAEGLLFTGDTLFAGSVGRTDLPGGNELQLTASLRRLAELPPATRVYPGHGDPTTIARERESNPFLQGL